MLRLTQRPCWIALRWVPLTRQQGAAYVGVYWYWREADYWTLRGHVTHDLHVYVFLVPCVALQIIIGRVD